MNVTIVKTISRPLTITEIIEVLHQSKLFLVELEDRASTREELQDHQQLLDQAARSLRPFEQSHQDLTIQVADLTSKLEKEISKTMALTGEVKDLKETIQKHSEIIETLQASLSPLITLQQSLSARQIATEADLKSIEHIFPGGSSAPYYFISVNQLDQFLEGNTTVVSGKAKAAWDAKSSVEQEVVENKLKVFLTKFNDFTYYTKLLKNANNLSAHAIVGGTREYYESVGDMNTVDAIDYCNNVKAEV
jgi:tetrahydromethanopterin S-methyltransferase subunit B